MLRSNATPADWLDPLAQNMLTMAGFRTISTLMLDLAEEVCDGRLLMLQEGGYSVAYVPYCTVAAVEPLVGVDLGLVDLYAGSSEVDRCMSIMTQETQDALAAAKKWHSNWWNI